MVSNDRRLETTSDMLVVVLTSNAAPVPYGFATDTGDLAAGRLNRPSTLRVDKVFPLSQALAIQVFGAVGAPVLEPIRATLGSLPAPMD